MDSADVSNNTKGIRFMGQRYVPDSYIFSQLVYDNVLQSTRDGSLRNLPKGLDVMAAFGNERAWELLEDDKQYRLYEQQMELLQEEFESMSLSTWTQNLYWLWLYSVQPLLEKSDENAPLFMTTPQWGDKKLMSALGTWTELRHDTVLYAKQSYTTYRVVSPTPPPGYVEPEPDLYARLASLCRMMLNGLEKRGLLHNNVAYRLQDLHRLLLNFQAISIKEMTGQSFNETDKVLLENVGTYLKFIEGLDTSCGEAALVVDVHTDANSDLVLEEATGNPLVMYVICPNENGEPFLARGAMYSYYEFTMPMNQRLTDEAWWLMLDSGTGPSMPEWSKSFIIDETDSLRQLRENYFLNMDSLIMNYKTTSMNTRNNEVSLVPYVAPISLRSLNHISNFHTKEGIQENHMRDRAFLRFII